MQNTAYIHTAPLSHSATARRLYSCSESTVVTAAPNAHSQALSAPLTISCSQPLTMKVYDTALKFTFPRCWFQISHGCTLSQIPRTQKAHKFGLYNYLLVCLLIYNPLVLNLSMSRVCLGLILVHSDFGHESHWVP